MKYVIAPVLLLAAFAFGQTWVVEQVDSTAASGSPVELVKAADGKLWAGYGTRTGAARVACLTDSGWRFTDVCSSARLPSSDFRPFLAASTHGELCLACYDSISGVNCFFRMANDSWRSVPNPYNDSPPLNTLVYDTSGGLYTLYVSYPVGASFGLGHETDSGWTASFVVSLPMYGFYVFGPIGHITTSADGSPWFLGYCGWDDGPPKSDCETNLLHFSGDSWVSAWDVKSYSYGEITPVPLALSPHGDGVGFLTWYSGFIQYDSESITQMSGGPYYPPAAGLAYTTDDVPLVASVPGLWTTARAPLFASKTNRWHVETIPGPAGIGGLDIEGDTSGQVVIVYSTQDSGLWCARGTDVVGVRDAPKPQAVSRKLEPTILSGASGVGRLASSVIFDAMGRRVLNPRPGVYFVREAQAQAQAQAVRKVIITK
jgi:hypothetical protein